MDSEPYVGTPTIPSDRIREIWMEMKELKRIIEKGWQYNSQVRERYQYLSEKYVAIETLFGHESTLSKAIIYYLDETK